jgi:hypothetical protein
MSIAIASDLGGIPAVQAQRLGESSQRLDTASLDHQEQP